MNGHVGEIKGDFIQSAPSRVSHCDERVAFDTGLRDVKPDHRTGMGVVNESRFGVEGDGEQKENRDECAQVSVFHGCAGMNGMATFLDDNMAKLQNYIWQNIKIARQHDSKMMAWQGAGFIAQVSNH
jgi:hypothetical protein